MGTDLDIQRLVYKRDEILKKILNDLKEWDNTIESGVELIESNQIQFNILEGINSELYKLADSPYQVEEYNLKLNAIKKELKKLVHGLQGKRSTLLEEKQQLSKKDQILKSYVSIKKDPVFIDKDVK
jgi:uncharacterized phage infection (PIP) family protein YhgE